MPHPAVGKAAQVAGDRPWWEAAARRESAEVSVWGCAVLHMIPSCSVTLWASLSDLPLSCGVLEQGESVKLHF